MSVAGICMLLSVAATCAAADHFPVEKGNAWLFSSITRSGGWGSSTEDSGTVRWEIDRIDILESFPVQYRIHIIQCRSLHRRQFTPGAHLPDSEEYDSVYTPARKTCDTLTLAKTDGDNGLSFTGDSCWSFVHDPEGEIPPGMVSLTDTSVSFRGGEHEAILVDPSPCRLSNTESNALPNPACLAPRTFLTADSIGPVGYYTESSPCIMDYHRRETWSIVWSNVGDWSGGPCEYVKVPGTARITRVSPVQDTHSGAHEAWFAFVSTGPMPQELATVDLMSEYPFSSVHNAESIIDSLHLRTGHVYPCTLSVITEGTCTPLMWYFGVPDDWSEYDTSSTWIEPAAVNANSAFSLTLLSTRFDCNWVFSEKTAEPVDGGQGLLLSYEVMQTRMACLKSAHLWGTPFSVDPLGKGLYPVYALEAPPCYPLCEIAVTPKLVDTLKVGDFPTQSRHARAPAPHGSSMIRLIDKGGVVECVVVSPRAGRVRVDLFDSRGAAIGSSHRAVSSNIPARFILDRSHEPPGGAVFLRAGLPDGSKVIRRVVNLQ